MNQGYDNGHGLILEGKGIPDEGMGLYHVLMKVGDGRDDVLPELDLRRKVKVEVNQAPYSIDKVADKKSSTSAFVFSTCQTQRLRQAPTRLLRLPRSWQKTVD